MANKKLTPEQLKVLQSVWDRCNVELPYHCSKVEFGDTFKRFQLDSKVYEVQIREVTK